MGRRSWLALAVALAPALSQGAGCEARSGAGTTPLVELYTSEGCSSCPPADAWLSGLGGQTVVTLAFHVDYWDYIGWQDPYADPRYSERQRDAARRGGARFVYTPQVMVNGRDFRGWASDSNVRGALDAIAVRPSRADLRLAVGSAQPADIRVGLEVAMREPRAAQAWIALYESRLQSEVRSGENAGRSLRHDWVVRRLAGPIEVPGSGQLTLNQDFALRPDWKRADLGVAAFVTGRDGGVLQAVQRVACGEAGS